MSRGRVLVHSMVSRIVIAQDGYKEVYDLKYDGKYVCEMTASPFENGKVSAVKREVVFLIMFFFGLVET